MSELPFFPEILVAQTKDQLIGSTYVIFVYDSKKYVREVWDDVRRYSTNGEAFLRRVITDKSILIQNYGHPKEGDIML